MSTSPSPPPAAPTPPTRPPSWLTIRQRAIVISQTVFTRLVTTLQTLHRQGALAPILVILVIVIIGLLIWKVPELVLSNVKHDSSPLKAKEYYDLQNSTRTTLAQIVGGGVVLLGAFFTWRQWVATRKTLEISLRSLDTTQQGQITDRFTKAVGQLGDDKIEIRLGGIYALERIARDSQRDHGPIMEILTAFVRDQTKDVQLDPLPETGPRTDIQAALTVIGRRNHQYDVNSLDLRGIIVPRADLRQAHLERAHLEEAHLERAHLERVHLQWAHLREAHLKRAYPWKAHLNVTDLSKAHLEGAVLSEAHLEGAILTKAHLEGAVLYGAFLERAPLYGAHLEGADLRAIGLTAERLAEAITDDKTQLPDYLRPQKQSSTPSPP